MAAALSWGTQAFTAVSYNELLAISCCGDLLRLKTGDNRNNLVIFSVVLCRKYLTKEENERSLLVVGFVISNSVWRQGIYL